MNGSVLERVTRMPVCVDCGLDTPREEMFGAGTDLRCPKCANKRRSVYVPPARPTLRVTGTLTKIMIVASVVLFILEKLPIGPMLGLQAGAIPNPSVYLEAFRPRLWDGELWRLTTSAFLHGDILHILFNCFFLWRFGPAIEAYLGRFLYLAFFVVVSFASMGAEVLASHGTPIGLSGVIYGMFGFLYAIRRQKDFAAAILDPATTQALVFWFFVCILLSASGTMAIANWAHGAGALAGWALGWASLRSSRQWLVPVVAALLLGVGASTGHMPWNGDYCKYRAFQSAQMGDAVGFQLWHQRMQKAIVPSSQPIILDEDG